MPVRTDLAYAQEMDSADPIAHFRGRFVVADPDMIYLDGNSLGRLPAATQQLATDIIVRQ